MSSKKRVHYHMEEDGLCIYFERKSSTEELLENKGDEKMVTKQV